MSETVTTSGRRELVLAVAGCAIAGAVALFAAGRQWAHFVVVGGGGGVNGGPSGHDLAAGASALGLVMLAGVVALPATRGLLRRLVGLVVLAAGAGTIALAADVLADPGAAGSFTGYVGFFAYSGNPTIALRATGWPWADVAAGILALAAGAFTLVRSGGWPAMGRRYESGGRAARPTSDASSMWDRLDHGDDPTV